MYGYTPSAASEIDFVVQDGTNIIPIEVKADENITSTSFKNYIAKHEPAKAVRFSKRGYEVNGSITNLPLYLAGRMDTLI